MLYLLLFTILTSCSLQNDEVIELEGFSINMPCEAEIVRESPSLRKHISEASCFIDETQYTVRITQFGNGLYHSDSLRSLDFDLDYSQRYFARNGKLNLIGMVLKTVNGYPGKEYIFQYKHEEKINFRRVYIIKDYLVELIYDAPISKLFHDEIDEFFDSFKVVDYDDNPTPYLNIPTNEEILNRPFIANFGGETIQKIEANDSDFGKIALILEIREFDSRLANGLIALSVMYGDFQQELSDSDKEEAIEIHKKVQRLTHPNFKWIEEKILDEHNRFFKYEYTINGVFIIETRNLFFKENRMYVISSITEKSQYPNIQAVEFLSSFDIKSIINDE